MQSPGFNNSPQQQGRVSARRGGQPNYNEDSPFERDDHPRHMPHERERPRKVIGPDGKERVINLILIFRNKANSVFSFFSKR